MKRRFINKAENGTLRGAESRAPFAFAFAFALSYELSVVVSDLNSQSISLADSRDGASRKG